MKKIIISSDALKPALKKVGQAINEKSVLPITKNLYCKVTKDQIELFATDLELTIAYKCICETGKDFDYDVLIPFDYISDIIAVAKSAVIVIEHPSARKLTIITEEDSFETPLDKLDEFPKLQVHPKKPMILLEENFSGLLTTALSTCGKDEKRPVMQRALFDVKKGQSFIVSTDAFALYRYAVKVKSEEPTQIQFSSKMIRAIDGIGAAELSWNQKNICIRNEKFAVWGTQFEDKYPNYNSIIPSYGPTLILDKSQLVDKLHKALISSGPTNKTTLLLNKEKGFVFFETEDPTIQRKNHVKLAGEFTGTVDQIAFSGKKLLTALSQVECEKIRLHIHDSKKAIVLSTEEDADHLGLVVPIYEK